MASLYLKKLKNKKGEIYAKIWYVSFYENGVRKFISTECTRITDANEWFRNWDGAGSNRYTFQKLSEIIMDQLDANNYAESTKEIYRTVFKDMLELFPKKKINTFSLKDVNTYKKYRKAKNKPGTVNIYLRTLRSIFQKAVSHKLLTRDKIPPIDEIPAGDDILNQNTGTYEPIQKSYTIAQFTEYLKFILNNPKYFADMTYQIRFFEFCLTSFYTGCRRNEVLGILLKNINVEDRVIPVIQTKKRGKKRLKWIPIHPYLWDVVLYKRFFDENGKKRKIDPNEKLIDLVPDYVTHKVKDINRALGYPESLKLHSIRHTYGTELNKAGVDKFNLRDLLGHSSLQSTEVYVHIDTNQLSASNSKLPALNLSNN